MDENEKKEKAEEIKKKAKALGTTNPHRSMPDSYLSRIRWIKEIWFHVTVRRW